MCRHAWEAAALPLSYTRDDPLIREPGAACQVRMALCQGFELGLTRFGDCG